MPIFRNCAADVPDLETAKAEVTSRKNIPRDTIMTEYLRMRLTIFKI